uniref:C2H2-type domain-containing protein n=1 Tax=Neogobius melanostomus TaxID=47308 RepID=A0A8C6T1X1_9GOBI
MEKRVSVLPGSSLSLSYLRLLVPPHRLVSAAIWQTVDQKIVSDYGLLEEFVFRVTDIVPQLLSTRQRAELILGLRARLILELCRTEDTAQIQIIQPHLDRMQELEALWTVKHPESHFMALVKSLLRDPDERKHFFNDVFPGDFGPTYDKAIQTLMWLFLSRFEKLLPTQSLQQVQDLVFQNVLSPRWFAFLVTAAPLSLQTQWIDLGNEVKSEATEVVVHSVESSKDNQCPDKSETLMIGEDGQVTVLSEQPKRGRGRPRKQPQDEDFEVKLTKELLEDPDFVIGQRPVQKQNKSPNKTKHFPESESSDLNDRTCKVCGKVMAQSKFLERHMSQHADEAPYSCLSCNKVYKSLRFLQNHKCATSITKEKGEQPGTDPDGQEVSTVDGAEEDSGPADDKSVTEGPFYCPQCSAEFKCRQTFRIPAIPMSTMCKRFRSYSDLVEHQKKHTKAYPYLCWECGKKFRHSLTLTRHVARVHHSGEPVMEKPAIFGCVQCGKMFTSRRCLLKHDNFHHKGLRFPCEHCGKGFFGKDALVRHTLIHTGERPFKCDDCDKSFRSLAELKIHRRYHTGERPFKCTICEKGFVQSCFLTLHMRTHTGERPYVCAVCNKGFSSLHGLKRHRRLVHT